MRIVSHPALVVGMALLIAACGDDPVGGGSETKTVDFVYSSPTSIDSTTAANFPNCVGGVEMTHIHPSWRNFTRINMFAEGTDRWTITFTDAPVGEFLRIRISDPNQCSATNPTGAATTGATANGATLTEIVETPGNGIEPGFGFEVNADGVVTPTSG